MRKLAYDTTIFGGALVCALGVMTFDPGVLLVGVGIWVSSTVIKPEVF